VRRPPKKNTESMADQLAYLLSRTISALENTIALVSRIIELEASSVMGPDVEEGCPHPPLSIKPHMKGSTYCTECNLVFFPKKGDA